MMMMFSVIETESVATLLWETRPFGVPEVSLPFWCCLLGGITTKNRDAAQSQCGSHPPGTSAVRLAKRIDSFVSSVRIDTFWKKNRRRRLQGLGICNFPANIAKIFLPLLTCSPQIAPNQKIKPDLCTQQCWSVFKIQVFKLLLKILYMYLLFSILNTFPVFILWLVFKLLFCIYLVFCSLHNQNTF